MEGWQRREKKVRQQRPFSEAELQRRVGSGQQN